jgi:hypothetical protein
MRAIFLIMILTLMGCSSGCTNWRTNAAQTLAGMADLASNASAFEKKHCGSPVAVVKACKARGDTTCNTFKICERFVKSLMTANAAVLTAQHALLQTKTTKDKAQALVQAALKAYGPVSATIKGWSQ